MATPCSIESTPAASELEIPGRAMACDATLWRSRWASSTMAFISSSVNVGIDESVPFLSMK